MEGARRVVSEDGFVLVVLEAVGMLDRVEELDEADLELGQMEAK